MLSKFDCFLVPNAPYDSSIVGVNTTSAILQLSYANNSVFDQITVNLTSNYSNVTSSQTFDATQSPALLSNVTLVNLTAGDVYTWSVFFTSAGLSSEIYNETELLIMGMCKHICAHVMSKHE
jgi:hypothetical protein